MAKAVPPECHLAVGSFVPGEWAKHAAPTRDELQKHLKAHDEASGDFRDACGHLGIGPGARSSFESSGLPAALYDLSSELLRRAIRLDPQNDLSLKAFARAAGHVPPSQGGGEIKDSTILEECLELCRSLRAAGFKNKLVYCTSNTRDYCEARRLHTELQAEFATLTLGFATTLPWALRELTV